MQSRTRNYDSHILYIEDDHVDFDLTEQSFHEQAPNLKLVQAQTGAIGLQLLSEKKWDLILLDYRLPDMSSFEILFEIKNIVPTIPVVVVTGKGDDTAVMNFLKAGAVDYIPKRDGYLESLPQKIESLVREKKIVCLNREESTRKHIHTLYVEPTQADVKLVSSHIARTAPHIRLHHAESINEALSFHGSGMMFDVVVSELRVRSERGLDFAEKLIELGYDTPFIIVAAHGDEYSAISAVKLGVKHFIHKNVNWYEIIPHAVESVYHEAQFKKISNAYHRELEAKNIILEQEVEVKISELTSEIGKRVLSEHNVRVSKETLRTTLEFVPFVIVLLDLEGKVLFSNIYANVNGPEDVLRNHVIQFLHPDRLALYRDIMEEIRKTGEFRSFEEEGFVDGKSIGWFHINIGVTRVKNEVRNFILTIREIHD